MAENGDAQGYTDIEVQLGGFYSYTENGSYQVFRLIDLRGSFCALQLFKEKFETIPAFEDVTDLSPFIGMVAVDTGFLLTAETLVLLGHREFLTHELQGYETYLSETEQYEAEDIQELMDTIIAYSKEAVLNVRLTEGEDGVRLEIL
jgi:hypothetical protein